MLIKNNIYLHKLNNSLTDSIQKIKSAISNKSTQIRILLIISLLAKSIIFTSLLNFTWSQFFDDASYSFVYLVSIVFIYSFGYLLPQKTQYIFYSLYNIIFSIILLFDLWYFRVNGDFIGIKNILVPGTFNPSEKSLINFKYYDILLFCDFIILIIHYLLKLMFSTAYKSFRVTKFTFERISSTNKKSNIEKINPKKFTISILCSILLSIISYLYFANYETSAFHNKLIYKQRSPITSVECTGPLNYHIFQDFISIKRYFTTIINKNDNILITSWINSNKENLPDNEYKGCSKNKNLIFLQIESLENFIIGQTAEGKEITPFLNSLCKKSLYFNNIYEQNNGGHSIDCDFLVNTSILPVGDDVAAIAYGENIYNNSLPRILSSEGYTTITSRPEKPGDFNWMELHKNCFGVDHVYSINDYEDDEDVGYGLSDKSSLTQFAKRISSLDKPFFAQTCTLTSHGPFNIDEKYRELNLPQNIENNYLGGYFESLHYTDKQIQLFFELLKQENLLDNSIIVIYGDHTGVHKYYNDSINSIDFDGNWWKDFDHKIPLIIYSSDMQPKIIENAGGQVDILPTVCYLLGIDDNKYKNTSMGRVLVNTNRYSTVIKDTETDSSNIKGFFEDYKEERHLLDAYIRGSDIIKNNYFYKNSFY